MDAPADGSTTWWVGAVLAVGAMVTRRPVVAIALTAYAREQDRAVEIADELLEAQEVDGET